MSHRSISNSYNKTKILQSESVPSCDWYINLQPRTNRTLAGVIIRPTYSCLIFQTMFHIALYEPEIAPNTGNIMRLCANNGCQLHLIEPLGFDLEEKKLRRAGLDYRDMANVTRHASFEAFLTAMIGKRIMACTTKGSRPHSELEYQAGDVLLFGPESRGLPMTIIDSIPPQQRLRIPMLPDSRSLNLSNAVAIISYEALRQLDYPGAL